MNQDKNFLLEQEKKRFQQILEFTTFYGTNKGLVDEDEQPEMSDDAPSMDDNQETNDMPPMDMGGDMQQMDVNNGEAPQMDTGGDMQQMDMGGDMGQQGNGQSPEGFNPQVEGGEDMGDITQGDFDDGIGPDDEVVDITDLTDAQDETNKKVKKLGFNLDKTFKQIEDFEKLIQSTNDKIGELQKEFERRNPTQQEKLSARAAVSYPFNVTPEDYWKDKEKTSNYSLDDDNNGDEQEQYTITAKDIDDNNWKSIADSMSLDDILHQTIGNTLP